MHQKVTRGKFDIPEARNTFHHCLGNGKVLDSGIQAMMFQQQTQLHLCGRLPISPMPMLEGSLQLNTERCNLVFSHTLGISFLGVYLGKFHPFLPYL